MTEQEAGGGMRHKEMAAAIKRWQKTGYGVNPNQVAFRHYPYARGCECMSCRPGLHPVLETFTNGSSEHFPTTYSEAESWVQAARKSGAITPHCPQCGMEMTNSCLSDGTPSWSCWICDEDA